MSQHFTSTCYMQVGNRAKKILTCKDYIKCLKKTFPIDPKDHFFEKLNITQEGKDVRSVNFD